MPFYSLKAMLLQTKVCTTVKQKDYEGAYLTMNPATIRLFIYIFALSSYRQKERHKKSEHTIRRTRFLCLDNANILFIQINLQMKEGRTLLKSSATIVVLLAILLFGSCQTTSKRLVVIEQNELYGYVNDKGDTIIHCIYPMAFTDTITHIGFVSDSSGVIKCFNNEGKFLFNVFQFDNGPDYPVEGLFRIVGENNLIGFADTLGNIVIAPQYQFARPFKDGKAQVTNSGKMMKDSNNVDAHEYWQSDNWQVITRPK